MGCGELFSLGYCRLPGQRREKGNMTMRTSAHSPIKYPINVEVKVKQQLLTAAPRDDGRSALFVVGRRCGCRWPVIVIACIHFRGARCRVRLLTGVPAVALCVADWLTDWLANSLSSELVSLAVAPNPSGLGGGIYAVHMHYVDAYSWQVHWIWQRYLRKCIEAYIMVPFRYHVHKL